MAKRRSSKPAESLELLAVEGAGNRFLLLDGLRSPVPPNPGGLAQSLCRASSGSRFRPDGLLILEAPPKDQPRALVAMVLFNADGTRPEACGNGLRCLAQVAVEHRHAPAGEFGIWTDAGLRRVRVPAGRWEGTSQVTVEIGPARLESEALAVEVDGETLQGRGVNLGNPHFVLEPRPWTDAEVARIGPALCGHAAFPAGANIGFPSQRDDGGLDLRVFERGVGETLACGTGACAAVAVTAGEGAVAAQQVHLPGGELQLERDGDEVWWLTGPVGR